MLEWRASSEWRPEDVKRKENEWADQLRYGEICFILAFSHLQKPPEAA
jgi:hypothetical protein